MKIIFWFSFFSILYTYLGYICILFIWSKVRPRPVKKVYKSPEPFVSVVIAVRNEEQSINKRLKNLLEQVYPKDNIEIIVSSDGSTDRTNNIVKSFINEINSSKQFQETYPKIKLIELPNNMGKAYAINEAIKQAKGKYIIFTDARQQFAPTVIRELVANFSDPKVGCVSGELIFYENSDTTIKAEMGFYWSFEKKIRKLESKVKSVVGATGAIYGIRRNLFRPMPRETILDDVYQPMNVVLQGYRTVFDEEAVAYDTISKDFAQERRRKVRTLLGNYQLVTLLPGLLSWRKNPILFQYISHKLLRLFVPFFFIALIVSSAALSGTIYKATCIGSLSIPLLQLLHRYLKYVPLLGKLSALANTFISLNYFALIAFFYAIKPGRKEIW